MAPLQVLRLSLPTDEDNEVQTAIPSVGISHLLTFHMFFHIVQFCLKKLFHTMKNNENISPRSKKP